MKLITGYTEKTFSSQKKEGVGSYEFSFSLDNVSESECYFNLKQKSGETVNSFQIQNGRILESITNKYIGGVNKNENNLIKMVRSGAFVNYYYNDLYVLNTSGFQESSEYDYIDKISVEPINCTCSLDFILSGKPPSYEFSLFRFSGAEGSGTGTVANLNPPVLFRVYSGVSQSGLFTFVNDTTDVSGEKNFNLVRNYTLLTQAELSDNVTPYDFTIYSNFGVFNERMSVETQFPIVQTLNFSEILSLSGISTGSSSFNWSNFKGATPYSEALPARLTISYLSGATGANSFNAIFSAAVANLPTGSVFNNINYVPSVTGYQFDFNTVGGSGYNYRVGRNIAGSTISLEVNYSGYNTGYNYVLNVG
jgi:hypothetical protein